MKRKSYIEIITGLLVFLFMYAGLSKLLDYHAFRFQLEQSPLLASWAGIITWSLPAGELLLSAMLILPATRQFGSVLSLILLAAFTTYLLYMLRSHKHLPCSCGGLIAFMSWRGHVTFNSVFMLLSLTGILLNRKRNRQTGITGFAEKDIVATKPLPGKRQQEVTENLKQSRDSFNFKNRT